METQPTLVALQVWCKSGKGPSKTDNKQNRFCLSVWLLSCQFQAPGGRGEGGGGYRGRETGQLQEVVLKLRPWPAELQDMHQTAQSDAKESREELDSLSNLIGRLDFNDFFKPKPDYRAMLANGSI